MGLNRDLLAPEGRPLANVHRRWQALSLPAPDPDPASINPHPGNKNLWIGEVGRGYAYLSPPAVTLDNRPLDDVIAAQQLCRLPHLAGKQ